MSSTASALPALPVTADTRSITERVNMLIRWFNRPDLIIPSYAADSGSGTAYAIAPSADIKQYVVGQVFNFIAANANTSATPTLAVGTLAAGTIKRANGTALSPGDIPAGPVSVVCTSTTPTFALISAVPTWAATTFLGADVALNNTASFFNGPSTGSIGGSGQTFKITAVAAVADSVGAAVFAVQIHNGTAAITGGGVVTSAAGNETVVTYEAVVTLAAPTTFTLQARDSTSTNGAIKATSGAAGSPANKATSITAVRLS